YLTYEVFKVEAESEVIRSFYLRRVDGKSLPHYEAGQFLPIRLTIPGQSEPVTRVYTLSDAPNGTHYRLSIKREGGDGLVSNFFHDQVSVGAHIEAMVPRGKFKVDQSSTRPVVLISAGVGITPMVAIANFLVEEGIRTRTYRPTYFIHGTRNGRSHAFGTHIRHLAETYPSVTAHISYSTPDPDDQVGIDYDSEGYVDIELLKQVLPFNDFDFYLCGPQAFMQSLYTGLTDLGVRPERIHYESFGPSTVLEISTPKPPQAQAQVQAQAPTGPVKVRFAKSAIETEWTPKQGTLLELAEANGLKPPYSCRAGICGVCATRVQCGTVDYVEEPTGHFADGEALICCSTPRSPSGKETCGEDIGIVLDL
ncbi:MAG: 2Fe-2S iron-sulfur cluster-binding protein, partial [Leptolyngbyaceae bacterium]|nr:2Fe-2S iron-sulfur cluster-binding protein [Leptolyngbyaceae bacterium]